MPVELGGSMLIYIILIITSRFSTVWRRFVFSFFAVYYYYVGAIPNELPFVFGAILADLSLDLQNQNHHTSKLRNEHPLSLPNILQPFKNGWPLFLIVIGLFVGSYPVLDVERTQWSNFLAILANNLFPRSGTPPGHTD